MPVRRWLAACGAGACCAACAAEAPAASSADGRWRVAGEDATVVVFDAGHVVKTLPARSLGGHEAARVTAVRFLPSRRSFLIAFDTLAELWELSIDPAAAPVFDGLVHDFRMGEAIATPGYLGVRRTPLAAPVTSLAIDGSNNAQVLARSADTWWVVNLDVRRAIASFGFDLNPELRRSGTQGD